MSQSRSRSALEAATNVIVGYWLAVGVQLAAFPALGIAATARQSLGLGLVFTVVSLLRGYLLRRLFDRWETG